MILARAEQLITFVILSQYYTIKCTNIRGAQKMLNEMHDQEDVCLLRHSLSSKVDYTGEHFQ